jgi:hypothetical protein
LAVVAFITLAVFFVLRRRRSFPTSSSNGDIDKSERAPLYNVAVDSQDDLKSVATTVDTSYPPPPPSSSSSVSYPLPPRNSIPRDPQLTVTDSHHSSQPHSAASVLKGPQSPIWKSFAFELIPKTPPGPELHYSESWGDYADIESKHHSKDSYSTYGGSSLSHDLSCSTIVDADSLYIDDLYDKRPFAPSRLSSDVIPGVRSLQSHDRNPEQIQESEQGCTSPLVSEATTLPSSDVDTPNVPNPDSKSIEP